MSSEVLISPEELHANLRNPNWAIFNCRFNLQPPDWGEAAYLLSHIPSAVYVHLERDLSAELTGTNGRHPLPTVGKLTTLFSVLGIGPQTQVIAYDDFGGPYEARLWWSLRYLGHETVKVLNGGLPAWLGMDYPVRRNPMIQLLAIFQAL
jgi:thiosulfate/3-mercaptopyruvate sulfurtransferase